MAKDFDNTNSGVLFKADKGENPKRPDYTGSINVGGTEYWLSAWIKEGAKGKFMSLSVKPKEERQEKPAPKQEPQNFDDLDSDVPF